MKSTEQPHLARDRGEMRERVHVPKLFTVDFLRAVLRKEFVGLTPDKFFP